MSKYTFDSELLSDLYKDAYGFRPDYAYMKAWHAYADDFKQVIWDRLLVDLQIAVEEEVTRIIILIKQYQADKAYQADKDDTHE